MKAYTTIEGYAQAEIEEKKSRFIASVAHVETEEEALAFLEEIRASNRMARHNVYAYVLRSADGQGTGGERVRYSDDGEPQKTAGVPTLEVIRHEGLTDIAVVVTRYFGGVLLGTGGLVRAYTQATQAGLAAANKVTVSRCVDLAIDMSYSSYEQVKRLAIECGAKVVDEQFTDKVVLTARLLDGTQDTFSGRLTELMHGREQVSATEPFDAIF
ncbi:MAG: YigZ family protein [Eggerthellaceae bacterium]|nr:YigZ family protein [Eggerthellaceae bacterium]